MTAVPKNEPPHAAQSRRPGVRSGHAKGDVVKAFRGFPLEVEVEGGVGSGAIFISVDRPGLGGPGMAVEVVGRFVPESLARGPRGAAWQRDAPMIVARAAGIQSCLDSAESILTGRAGQKLAEAGKIRVASRIAGGAGRVKI